jgi:RNA polymerase sigma-70 factor (ECF subfamily)
MRNQVITKLTEKFSPFFRKYGKYLLAVAYNILQDREDSKECQNDTYLRIWNSIPPERPRAFSAYLAKIIRGLAINRLRDARRKKRIPPELIHSLSELEGVLPAQIDEEQSRLIAQVISAFLRGESENGRYIFMSRYFYMRPISHVADALGVSQSTVKKRLQTMKEKLREALEKEEISL